MNFKEFTPQQRFARTSVFKWMAREFKRMEQQKSKKISKNVRRRICLELDCDITIRCIPAVDF